MTEIAFDRLANADLVVDAVYKGGTLGHKGDDPIARLLPVGNSGGFRPRFHGTMPKVVVLFSTGSEPDWPDNLDGETGQLTYFGDNRRPGKDLHETSGGGNRLLRTCFEAIHGQPPLRATVPPFLVFTATGKGRDVRFRGLAVPGGRTLAVNEDLVAVWRATAGLRFQNYRARFTVLDISVVTRAWIAELLESRSPPVHAPQAWRNWVSSGMVSALVAPRTRAARNPEEQLPETHVEKQMIGVVYAHFRDDPYRFEACAAELARMMAPAILECDLTRPWADGGRDAVGTYRLGPPSDPIRVEFALEAKCYALDNGVGVKEAARLISRLRFRQFGILVTTSYVARQAYEEIRSDGHPVAILSARDIVLLLKEKGLHTPEDVRVWLNGLFPPAP